MARDSPSRGDAAAAAGTRYAVLAALVARRRLADSDPSFAASLASALVFPASVAAVADGLGASGVAGAGALRPLPPPRASPRA